MADKLGLKYTGGHRELRKNHAQKTQPLIKRLRFFAWAGISDDTKPLQTYISLHSESKPTTRLLISTAWRTHRCRNQRRRKQRPPWSDNSICTSLGPCAQHCTARSRKPGIPGLFSASRFCSAEDCLPGRDMLAKRAVVLHKQDCGLVLEQQFFDLHAGDYVDEIHRLIPQIQMGLFAKAAGDQDLFLLPALKSRISFQTGSAKSPAS